MDCDVLIVGGGPAGLSAAFFLSSSGLKVVVTERLPIERYERYHSICGEGISNDTLLDLRPMEPWGVKNNISKTTLVWPNGKEIDVPVKGFIIDRPTFLSEVRERCNAEFIQTSVRDIRSAEGSYEAICSDGRTIRCKYLIGADGAWSIVRKKMFDSRPRTCEPVKHFLMENTGVKDLRIYLDERYEGAYKWEFPSGEYMTVGFEKGKETVENPIRESGRYIPCGGVGDIVKENVLLVGDAAAMPNPVSFGGLKAALLSGKKAAEAVMKQRPSMYQRWWKRSILSSKRFIWFQNKLKSWSNEDMNKAVKPINSRFLIISAIWAVISRPWNIGMYIGCLFAFKFSW